MAIKQSMCSIYARVIEYPLRCAVILGWHERFSFNDSSCLLPYVINLMRNIIVIFYKISFYYTALTASSLPCTVVVAVVLVAG